MKRQRARAARSACDSRGCPVRRAARADLRSWAHRRTAGAVTVAPVPGAEAGTVAPAALVVTAAFGALAAFRVASSRAAWLAGAAPPPSAAAPPPVLPAEPLPLVPVLAAGAADRLVPARDIPAITPPPASRAARAIPAVQRQALPWSRAGCACGPGCCGQGYSWPGPWPPGGTPGPGQNCSVGWWSPRSPPAGRLKLSMAAIVPAGSVTSGSRSWDFAGSTLRVHPGTAPPAVSGPGACRLHPLGHRDPEHAEPGGQDPQGQGAEREPAVAQLGRGGAQHRAMLVERGERAGDVEQVARQHVWLGGLAGLGHGRAELERRERERPFRVLGQMQRVAHLLRIEPGLAEYRADPRGGVLKIRPGVTGEREHPVEVEDVAGLPGHGQVGVLERADADRLGDLVPLRRVLVAVGDDPPGPLDGLVDQVRQLDLLAGAGLEPLPAGAGHQANGRVLCARTVGQPA